MDLAEHLVHGVYDCLGLIQLNLVARSLDELVYAMRREVREPLLQSNPDLHAQVVAMDQSRHLRNVARNRH